MVVLGVDLAADPANTGAAMLIVEAGRAVADVVGPPVGDAVLVELAGTARKVGVDSPLGWPDDFVEAVGRHHRGRSWPAADDPVAQRRLLSKRATDRFVKVETGLDPMSVSADRIGAVAMRCARLQTLWAADWGGAADRAGTGRLAETYPAGALKTWGLVHRRYKGRDGAQPRGLLVDSLLVAAPWLSFDDDGAACRLSDHTFDAVICALVALAATVGLTRAASAGPELDRAGREGWIHLPTCTLAELWAVVST